MNSITLTVSSPTTSTSSSGTVQVSTFNDSVTPSKSLKRGSAPVMLSLEKTRKITPKIPFPSDADMTSDHVSPFKPSVKTSLSVRTESSQSPKSPRAFEDELPPSSRHRIEKKPYISTDGSTRPSLQKRDPSSRSSAPPKMIATADIHHADMNLEELSEEFAKSWIKAAKLAASKPKVNIKQSDSAILSSPPGKSILTEAIIRSISRSDCQIPKSKIHPHLLAILPTTNDKEFVPHAEILNALFGQSLRNSIAGKTLLTMKLAALESNPAYAQITIDSIRKEELKQAGIESMQPQARAAVDMSLGMGKHSLATSKLPAALINGWKLMDRELVKWAKENPLLSDEIIQTARSNLGIDTIITRMIYPLIYGSPHESHLLAPGWYANAVKSILIAEWPEFFADFVKQTEDEKKFS